MNRIVRAIPGSSVCEARTEICTDSAHPRIIVRKPMVEWEAPFPEDLHTSVDRAVRAAQLHLEVFQAYMEDHPGHGNYALRISRAVRIALISMRGLSYWKHIPEYARRAFGDWAAGTAGIEEQTGSSTHK